VGACANISVGLILTIFHNIGLSTLFLSCNLPQIFVQTQCILQFYEHTFTNGLTPSVNKPMFNFDQGFPISYY
jgi:hypothetical protein